jgi:hypothetical protein
LEGWLRVFKTKWFGRFARKEGIRDQKLAEAVREVEKGLHDGDLGGGLVKKRLARAGEGKRGGYRTIIVYHKGRLAVFLYGFAKSDKENLDPVELREYQKLAQIYWRFGEADIAKAIRGGELQEIEDYDEKISQ